MTSSSFAQDQAYLNEISDKIKYWNAPKVKGKQVQSIKEWRRNRNSESIRLASVHQFREDGQLNWAEFDDGLEAERYQLGYQENGSLFSVEKNIGEDQFFYYFAMMDDREVMEKRSKEDIWKTIFYKDAKGQIIERKEFFYGPSVEGIHYLLLRRTVYNIDAEGLLKGEMRYEYEADGSFEKSKTIHQYDPESGHKSKIIYYQDGSPFESEQFSYDTNNLLKKMEQKSELLKHHLFKQELYHYQNEQLERVERNIFLSGKPQRPDYTEHLIYDGDLLIYHRVSDFKGMVYESNFQYIFE